LFKHRFKGGSLHFILSSKPENVSKNKTHFLFLFFAVNLNFSFYFAFIRFTMSLTNIQMNDLQGFSRITSRTAFLRHLKHDLFIMHSTNIFSENKTKKKESRKGFVRVLIKRFFFVFITSWRFSQPFTSIFQRPFTHKRTWKMIIIATHANENECKTEIRKCNFSQAWIWLFFQAHNVLLQAEKCFTRFFF
jgi:hypothetical protein